ncbi:hypothetical protein EVAR_48667_1 [Eumeta japonica]|uniref:Uncharacterized protein n=1 Tax=Eumeta variegata TaxID=151549 RepID=A0A4C1XBG2_EUMVA|nr:hypothetical protein EVAR_48667_1 [Eumeta japonica]
MELRTSLKICAKPGSRSRKRNGIAERRSGEEMRARAQGAAAVCRRRPARAYGIPKIIQTGKVCASACRVLPVVGFRLSRSNTDCLSDKQSFSREDVSPRGIEERTLPD